MTIGGLTLLVVNEGVDEVPRFVYSGTGEIGLQGRIVADNHTAPTSVSKRRRSKAAKQTSSRVQARGTTVDPMHAVAVEKVSCSMS